MTSLIQEMEILEPIFSLSQSDICRICGLNDTPGFLIFEKLDDNELTIADLINRYLPIDVSDDGKYPRIICPKCKNHLDIIVKFIDELLAGQSFLKNIHKMYESKQFSTAEFTTSDIERTVHIKENVNTNSTDVEFVCETCGLRLAHENDLKIHMENHHEKSLGNNETKDTAVRYSCGHCKKTFAHKNGLATHLDTHKGNKKYECRVCQKKYYQNGNLQVHMRIHTGEKPFTCDYCLVAFRTSSQLKTHIRRHFGAKPFKCSVCEKLFPHLNTLKNHLRRHNNDRPYTCEYCEKKFIDTTALVRHVRTHTGEKPYQCNICLRNFASVSNFNKHKKTHMKEKNSTLWELTTKFQKDSSDIDYMSATIINDDDLGIHERTENLFSNSNQVKDLNVDMPSNNDNNLDTLLDTSTSFTSLNCISFSESILNENTVP